MKSGENAVTYHGRHQLTAEPSSTTWSDIGLKDRDLEVRAVLREVVRARKASTAGADDDDVRDGAIIHHVEVPVGQ